MYWATGAPVGGREDHRCRRLTAHPQARLKSENLLRSFYPLQSKAASQNVNNKNKAGGNPQAAANSGGKGSNKANFPGGPLGRGGFQPPFMQGGPV